MVLAPVKERVLSKKERDAARRLRNTLQWLYPDLCTEFELDRVSDEVVAYVANELFRSLVVN